MMKLHRRAMLAGTAALPAIATTTAFADIWAPRPDPIFAAIERHRAAMASYDAAVDVSARLRDDDPRHAAANAVTDRADRELEHAGAALADIEPTTAAGLRAVLAHVLECIRESNGDGRPASETFDGGNWRLPHTVALDDDTDEHFMVRLLRSIERTIGSLPVRA